MEKPKVASTIFCLGIKPHTGLTGVSDELPRGRILTKCGVLILLHTSLQHILWFLLQQAQIMRVEQAILCSACRNNSLSLPLPAACGWFLHLDWVTLSLCAYICPWPAIAPLIQWQIYLQTIGKCICKILHSNGESQPFLFVVDAEWLA